MADELAKLQHWFQAVMTHPGGAAMGAATDKARRWVAAGLDEVVGASLSQTAVERLDVYAHGYWARLLECLREEFPVLRTAIGDEAFDGLAVGYLTDRPSTSYTLGRLSERFAEHLQSTLGDQRDDDFGRFVVELARLERAINDVFDAPGGETLGFLTAEELAAIPAYEQAALSLCLLPTVRLLEFEFDVNSFYGALRFGSETLPSPEKRRSFLALSRRGYVVRRHPVDEPQFQMLQQIASGRTLGEALSAVLYATAGSNAVPQVNDVYAWFAAWSHAGLFQQLAPPPAGF
ncbi:MAG: DNA-binding domain-containing protein [Pirellulales bacterium]